MTAAGGVVPPENCDGVNSQAKACNTRTCDSATTTTAATTTAATTTPPNNCADVSIISAKAPTGKVKANLKYPMGGISANSWQIRYNFVNKNLWTKPYLGYLTFTKALCGQKFLTALMEGQVKFDILDKTDIYSTSKQWKSMTKSGVTIGFFHKEKGTTKTDYGNAKKDQVFLMLTGVNSVEWGNKKAKTCFEKAKIDMIKNANNVGTGKEDYSSCIAQQYVRSWD